MRKLIPLISALAMLLPTICLAAGDAPSRLVEVASVNFGEADVVAVDPTNGIIVGAEAGSPALKLYDQHSGKLLKKEDLSGSFNFFVPIAMAIDPVTKKIFVSDSITINKSQRVIVYDERTLENIGIIQGFKNNSFDRVGNLSIDSKLRRLIVEDKHGVEFFDLNTLNYISSLKLIAPSSLDPLSDQTEMFYLTFDPTYRNIFFAKTVADNKSCIVAFNIDTGRIAGTIGECDGQKNNKQDILDVQSGTVDPSSKTLIITDRDRPGQGLPRRFRVMAFDTKTLRLKSALSSEDDKNLIDLKSTSVAPFTTYVLCGDRPPYSNTVVKVLAIRN